MQRILRMIWIGFLITGLCGCLQTTDEYTLNPDGSGKVVHEALLTPIDLGMNAGLSPEEKLMNVVQEEMGKAEGIEAWEDVSYERQADGKILFKATAYFPDIHQLQFHNAGGKLSMLKEKLTVDDKRLILELVNAPSEKKEGEPPEDLSSLSDEELSAKIQEEKNKYEQQMKPMLAGIFQTMKVTKIYHLPGSIVQADNMQPAPEGGYQVVFDGSKILDLFDDLFVDEEWLKKQIRQGRDIMKDAPEDDLMMNKALFGEEGPVKLVSEGPLTPLFDYAQEVAAARSDFEQVQEEIDVPQPAEVATLYSSELLPAKVGGVRLVYYNDEVIELRPFNWDLGYTLSLVVTLPDKAVSVSEGKMLSAVADTGEDLLPENEWERPISFPELGKDQRTVLFEVKLKVPDEDVKGLRELSGTLDYLVSSGTKEVDLGITEFTAGAQGTEYNAAIVSIGPSKWDASETVLALKLNLKTDSVKSVEFYDDNGQALGLERSGYSSTGAVTSFFYRVDKGLPDKGRIKIQVYEGQQKRQVTFRLEHILLTGQPA